jgi:pseudouridine-5'-phosphate glycosidase
MDLKLFGSSIMLSTEVAGALSEGQPICALETTILSHGLPRPFNLEVAHRVEQAVRAAGAVPATIGIIGGIIHIGLEEDELEQVSLDTGSVKASLKDIPGVMISGKTAGCTVAATIAIARAAGISVFATGGIGGVHMGAEETFDVSADLPTLANSEIIVICSGPKNVLDVAKTVEYLETLSIPVVGYRTDRMPLFYARSSEFGVDFNASDPDEVARFARYRWALTSGGVLVTNPVPADAEMDPELFKRVSQDARSAALEKGIRKAEVTPFLLDYIHRHSGGASLKANAALIESNAQLGANIAVALQKQG